MLTEQLTLFSRPFQFPPSQKLTGPKQKPESGIRKLKIEAHDDLLILHIGQNVICQVTDDHSADFCTCLGATKGGLLPPTPLQPGDPAACEHLVCLWRLAWGRSGPRDIKNFRQVLGLLQQGRARQTMISWTVWAAKERMIAQYIIKEKVYFTMDIVHDIQLADVETQKWKAAVAVALSREGFWIATGRRATSIFPETHHYHLSEYRLTDETIAKIRNRARNPQRE